MSVAVHGIYRVNTEDRRARRRAFLDDLKAALPVYPITYNNAELAGKISGVVIPIHDLLIGVCALEHGYAVAPRSLPRTPVIQLKNILKIP